MFESGDLVKVFAPGHGFIDGSGFAVFLRKVLPSRDLPHDHNFWKKDTLTMTEGSALASSWHYEVLYGGRLFLLHEKQFVLMPADNGELENEEVCPDPDTGLQDS